MAFRSQPDIVHLQELKAPDERFPIGAIEDAGYEAIWHDQKSWNGVAILSLVGTPIETRRAPYQAIPTTCTAAARRRAAEFRDFHKETDAQEAATLHDADNPPSNRFGAMWSTHSNHVAITRRRWRPSR